LVINKSINAIPIFDFNRHYAAKPKALTDAQIQLQKYASEMQFKAKTSLKGTKFEFQDIDTSKRYMESEGTKIEKHFKYYF